MPTQDTGQELARQVRERFVRAIAQLVPKLSATLTQVLGEAVKSNLRGLQIPLQDVLEAPRAFKKAQTQWEQAVRREWLRSTRETQKDPEPKGDLFGRLELVDDSVVEGKILAARLGASINEANANVWSDLQVRMQRLEYSRRLDSDDPLRAEVFVRCLLTAWRDCGLSQPIWTLVQDSIKPVLINGYRDAYTKANNFLFQAGIPAELDLKARLRRGADLPGTGAAVPMAAMPGSAAGHAQGMAAYGAPLGPHTGYGYAAQQAAVPVNAYRAGPVWMTLATPMATGPHRSHHGQPTGGAGVAGAGMAAGQPHGRLSLAWALQRQPQQPWMDLESLLTQRVPGYDIAGGGGVPLSPALAQALAAPMTHFGPSAIMLPDEAAEAAVAASGALRSMSALAHHLRQRADALKQEAEKPSERAIIEVVALIFQAILAEESIADGIKVWFARLQVPVLRVALSESDFFSREEEHPARKLIDRMGGCAMGLDVAVVPLQPLEHEIRRVVEVIEQYPDVGGQVFEAMLRQFETFLERWLTDSEALQQATSLAQRVEQREALVVQYSIELARMLKALPLAEDVRQFLFQVWSDVLAVATVRVGSDHDDTQRFKTAATDLIRVTSVQPDRQRRMQVVQDLAGLLAVLREGMTSVGLSESAQEEHLQKIKDAVAQAFEGRGDGLSTEDLTRFAQSLNSLEAVVSDDPEGDMMLDPGVIELMFGEDSAAVISVIASGGQRPSEQLVAAVRELQRGDWFTLDFEGETVQVQYVWRSRRGQLHLFAAGSEQAFLVQTQRLAGYFQAGLMTPAAPEGLMFKATRIALTQLQDSPEDLLE